MSTVCLPQRPGSANAPAAPEATTTAVEFHYVSTESFAVLLQQLLAALLVSTYQANKLLVVRAAQGGLSTLVRTFERPMGLAVDARRLAIATHNQGNAPDLASVKPPMIASW